jgi:hypothetical protein
MYSDFALLDDDSADGGTERIERLAFGDTSGRNEAWLRDVLLANPGLVPIREIDPSYGPLIPLCKEMRTQAGPIDASFISPQGRLTFVECKLWRNPEARRKVVAQILDYARVVSRWSYSDLQRSVAIATGGRGNVPFELARKIEPSLQEHQFVDQTAAALREGRFLLVIAGDGIRDDVGAMAELITRNAALGFSFALVEVALYGMPDGRLLVQPRVTARTQIMERVVVLVRGEARQAITESEEALVEASEEPDVEGNALGESPRQAAYRRWWQPVLDAPLDDPDQEPPKLYWPNNVRVPLPWKQTWLLVYALGGESGTIGVCTAGRMGADQEMLREIEPEMPDILAELPVGTEYRRFQTSPAMTIACQRPASEFANDDERRAWLIETLNSFVNVLRPRIKRMIHR